MTVEFPTRQDPGHRGVAESITAGKTAPPWGSLAMVLAMVCGGLALETDDGRRVHLRGFPAAVLPEVCWSKRWLGWSCPLCGSTRSVILLVRGRWSESWVMQPAGGLVLMTAVISAGISWFGYFRGDPSRRLVARLTQILWLGLFLFLVFRHAWIAVGGAESAANLSGTHASAPAVR